MVPYEMFAMTGEFNVFAVAPDNKVKSITGGLDLLPHYSFKEMDRLLGKSPDIIVIPYMPMVDKKKYQPVREWIQKHKDATLLSICGGAANLADTGLLKGNLQPYTGSISIKRKRNILTLTGKGIFGMYMTVTSWLRLD